VRLDGNTLSLLSITHGPFILTWNLGLGPLTDAGPAQIFLDSVVSKEHRKLSLRLDRAAFAKSDRNCLVVAS
jgi:hypothetical protein